MKVFAALNQPYPLMLGIAVVCGFPFDQSWAKEEVGKTFDAVRGVRIVSWNLRHLQHRGQDMDSISKLLVTLQPDLIGLQEVNTSHSGAKGVESVATAMTAARGEKYCHALSDVPSGGRERYAFIWRSSRLSYVKTSGQVIDGCPAFAITLPLLDRRAADIVREPTYGVFRVSGSQEKFLATSIHLVPSGKKPETEIAPLFDSMPKPGEPFSNLPYVLMGDFNLASSHPAFDTARAAGFTSVLPSGTLTSLKSGRREMNKEYDAFFVRKAHCVSMGAVNTLDFFSDKSTKDIFNNISDHVPIVMDCEFDSGGKR